MPPVLQTETQVVDLSARSRYSSAVGSMIPKCAEPGSIKEKSLSVAAAILNF